jgi:PhnB protein
MQLEPYLFFEGTCEAALTHYAKVFGGQITAIHRFGDMPADAGHPQMPDDYKQKVMHASFEAPGFKLMGSDGRPGTEQKGGNISLSLATTDLADGERVFNALSEGGKVEVPLADQFWGARFGSFTDRFGIDWMISIALTPATSAH